MRKAELAAALFGPRVAQAAFRTASSVPSHAAPAVVAALEGGDWAPEDGQQGQEEGASIR